jgi:hypothetical protein
MLVKQRVDCEPLVMVTVLVVGCVRSMNYFKVPVGDQCNRELGAVCNKTVIYAVFEVFWVGCECYYVGRKW